MFTWYLYKTYSNCGCNIEKFMDLDEFKKIIFGKKIDNLYPKFKSEVEKDLKKIKNNFSTYKNHIIELKSYPGKIITGFNEEIKSTRVIPTFTSILNVFPINKLLKKGDRIEITDLNILNVPIKMDLTNSNNFIKNSNKMIYMDIERPQSNKAVIYNKNYSLNKICWEKSQLTWHDQQIHLHIRICFNNNETGDFINIIFPLHIENMLEKFDDTYYEDNINFKTTFSQTKDRISKSMKSGIIHPSFESKYVEFPENDKNIIVSEIKLNNKNLKSNMLFGFMDNADDSLMISNEIQQESSQDYPNSLTNLNLDKIKSDEVPSDINIDYINKYLEQINFNEITKDIHNVKYSIRELMSFLYLDFLITDESIIPEYICCNESTNSTQIINFDLQELEKKILNQESFYCTSGIDNSVIYITQPYPFNKKIGKKIYNNIGEKIKLI